MKNYTLRLLNLVLLVGLFTTAWAKPTDYLITRFGAKADGKTLNTVAIQRAIDACNRTGGRVVIPNGTFVSGTLYLKSNVNLHLLPGAVLLGVADLTAYPAHTVRFVSAFSHTKDGRSRPNHALLFAEGEHDIAITGTGTIDGNGKAPAFQLGDDWKSKASGDRPVTILLIDCRTIRVTDVHLRDSAYWLQHYLGCENVTIQRITVYNHANFNTDGIDIDSRNVLIEDCRIDCDDDGICLKSHSRARPCENVTVRNCTVASNCNAIKFGTAGFGGFKNVTISNCRIQRASEDQIRHWQQNLPFIGKPVTGIAGLALEIVDGGVLDNVTISDIQMTDVQTPIFVVLGNRGGLMPGETQAPVGQLKNLRIRNVMAEGQSKMTSSITAFPGHYVENVELNYITLSNMGTGTAEEATKPLKENPKSYPENRMYGSVYPASGLFVRHVKGLTLQNVTLRNRQPDARPALILDDVEDATITGLQADAPTGDQTVVKVTNSRQVRLQKPDVMGTFASLLDASDTSNRDVSLKTSPATER